MILKVLFELLIKSYKFNLYFENKSISVKCMQYVLLLFSDLKQTASLSFRGIASRQFVFIFVSLSVFEQNNWKRTWPVLITFSGNVGLGLGKMCLDFGGDLNPDVDPGGVC